MKITGQKVIAFTAEEKEALKKARRTVDDLIDELDAFHIEEYDLYNLSDYLYNLIHNDNFIITLDVKEDM